MINVSNEEKQLCGLRERLQKRHRRSRACPRAGGQAHKGPIAADATIPILLPLSGDIAGMAGLAAGSTQSRMTPEADMNAQTVTLFRVLERPRLSRHETREQADEPHYDKRRLRELSRESNLSISSSITPAWRFTMT